MQSLRKLTLFFSIINFLIYSYYTPNNDSTLSINGETAPELSGDMTIPLNKAFKTQIDFSTQFLDPTLGTINNKYVLTFDRGNKIFKINFTKKLNSFTI